MQFAFDKKVLCEKRGCSELHEQNQQFVVTADDHLKRILRFCQALLGDRRERLHGPPMLDFVEMTAERKSQRTPRIGFRHIEAEPPTELTVGVDDRREIRFETFGEVVETELQVLLINRRVVFPESPPHICDESIGMID
jgi:hypothetical protein